MAVFKLLLLFVLAGTIAMAGVVILGMLTFIANAIKKKPQNILRVIIKMPVAVILAALILICFLVPMFFGEFVEDNVVLFYFIIGIPTIIISKSLTHELKKYEKDIFAWIYTMLFGFASGSLCYLLHALLYRFMTGEWGGYSALNSLVISAIVGIISVIVNLMEINGGNIKKISKE